MKFNTLFLFLFLSILFLSLSNVLIADDISQKERELSEVQRLINEQRNRAEVTESLRRDAEQSRQQARSQLSATQNRFNALLVEGQNLQMVLEQSRNMLFQAENRLTQIQYTCHEAMLYLLLADQSHEKLKQPATDAHLLGKYLNKLIEENSKLSVDKVMLASETISREIEFQENANLSHAEHDRLSNLSTNIRQLDTDLENLQRQRDEYQRQANELEVSARALNELISRLRTETQPTTRSYVFSAGVEAPVRGRIITHFGPRRHERYDISTISNGIDIMVPENTQVRALSDGDIIFADWFSGLGRLVIIDHKNGYHSVYSNINTIHVRTGDSVRRGQTIAESGRSIITTEPSLHFEIRRNNSPVNPLDYIRITP
jgi:septal ring factor EnvC (AmiA/AmiB activator)